MPNKFIENTISILKIAIQFIQFNFIKKIHNLCINWFKKIKKSHKIVRL